MLPRAAMRPSTVVSLPYACTRLARDMALGLDLNWVMNAYLPFFWLAGPAAALRCLAWQNGRLSTVAARPLPVPVPRPEARSAIRPATGHRAGRRWRRSGFSRRLD